MPADGISLPPKRDFGTSRRGGSKVRLHQTRHRTEEVMTAWRNADIRQCPLHVRFLGRVEMWRGFFRSDISVSAPFVWRCLSGSTVAPFPHPAHRTGRADFPHPALGQDFTPVFDVRRLLQFLNPSWSV